MGAALLLRLRLIRCISSTVKRKPRCGGSVRHSLCRGCRVSGGLSEGG